MHRDAIQKRVKHPPSHCKRKINILVHYSQPFVGLWICTCICRSICIHTRIHTRALYIHIYTYTCLSTYTCVCAWVHICMSNCMYCMRIDTRMLAYVPVTAVNRGIHWAPLRPLVTVCANFIRHAKHGLSNSFHIIGTRAAPKLLPRSCAKLGSSQTLLAEGIIGFPS